MNADPYIRQVASLGDSHEVLAREDILNANGVSLIKQGTRIDSSVYDRLVQHKLLRSLDESLSIANAVSPLGLVGDAKTLLANEPDLARVIDERIAQRVLPPLGAVRLEPPLAVKLTICRERSIERYQHQLRVTLVALYIATHLRWPHDDLVDLATAAIFHDLGELHLEPSLFDRSNVLTAAERRQIYAHPTIAFLFLKEFPIYRPKISHIVHQHHERLDGSGYPKGLSGDAVLPAARLMGAAELLTVIRLEKHKGMNDASSVTDILNFNTERFGSEFILPLLDAANRLKEDEIRVITSDSTDKTALEKRLNLLSETLLGIKNIDVAHRRDAIDFISKQMERIAAMAKRSGIDLNAPSNFLDVIGNDAHALSELDALVQEMVFLTHSTAREGLRRWDKPEHGDDALIEWLRQVDSTLQSVTIQSAQVADA